MSGKDSEEPNWRSDGGTRENEHCSEDDTGADFSVWGLWIGKLILAQKVEFATDPSHYRGTSEQPHERPYFGQCHTRERERERKGCILSSYAPVGGRAHVVAAVAAAIMGHAGGGGGGGGGDSYGPMGGRWKTPQQWQRRRRRQQHHLSQLAASAQVERTSNPLRCPFTLSLEWTFPDLEHQEQWLCSINTRLWPATRPI